MGLGTGKGKSWQRGWEGRVLLKYGKGKGGRDWAKKKGKGEVYRFKGKEFISWLCTLRMFNLNKSGLKLSSSHVWLL